MRSSRIECAAVAPHAHQLFVHCIAGLRPVNSAMACGVRERCSENYTLRKLQTRSENSSFCRLPAREICVRGDCLFARWTERPNRAEFP